MFRKGFTLIELLVVIVIIGILATVVIASVSSARAKARDATRKTDLDSIRTAVEVYYDSNNSYKIKMRGGAGTGQNGYSIGWFNCENGSSYPKSIGHGLVDAGLFNPAPQDPTAGTSCSNSKGGYMYYTNGNKYSIYTKLEKPTKQDLATCTQNPRCAAGLNGMNYVIGTGY